MCGGCVVEAPSPCPFHDPPSIRPSARLFVFSSGFVLVDGSCGWVGGVYGCSVSALGFSMRLVAALKLLLWRPIIRNTGVRWRIAGCGGRCLFEGAGFVVKDFWWFVDICGGFLPPSVKFKGF